MTGDEIRAARKARLMSQDDLARELMVANLTVRRWENGSRVTRPENLARLRMLLCSVTETKEEPNGNA